jgi:hypothetical protein
MDADVTTLFKDVDESYVTEVNTEQSSVAALVVDGEEKAKTVACGWSASEGKAPESPVFDSEGGNKSFIVTSMHPGDVLTKGTARIVYDEPKWPVVVAKEEQPISEGPIVFKPSQYVGRHMIYMYVLDANDKIKLPIDEREHLIVNVAYTYMDTLTNPGKPPRKKTLRASARITAEGPMEFSYPFDPAAEEGKAMFSAFGVIGGKLVRAKAQPINFQEDSVFILAGPKGIQLVSDAFPETGRSVDEVARRLLSSRARPVVESSSPEVARELHREEVVRRAIRTEALRGGRAAETGRYLDEELATMLRSEAERTPARDLTEVSGKVMGVEYTPSGARLLVQDNGNVRPILLDRALADEALDQFDEPDKWVTVKLDDSGVARSILVRLGG